MGVFGKKSLNPGDPIQDGGPGDDAFNAPAGSSGINGFGGIDTVAFNFRLVDATISYSGATVIIDTATSHTELTGIQRYVFTDGTVDEHDGNALVDDLFYYSRNHDVWSANVDAEAHFAQFGWKQGLNPSAFFNTKLYLVANSDVAAAGVDPLEHFHTFGWKEGRLPSIRFDSFQYLQNNPDVAASGVDPLEHFLAFGRDEGRASYVSNFSVFGPSGFDHAFYLLQNPDVEAAGVDPLVHFLTIGWTEGRNPSAWFDVRGYLATYTDVAASGVNPFVHFLQFGWKEGRDPSPAFDTTAYLLANPDVAAAGVNPLLHYLQYGVHEGRTAFALPISSTSGDGILPEGAAAGTGTGVDVDWGGWVSPLLTFSITGDTSGGGFVIDASTGVVTVADSTKLDFETSGAAHSYIITVQAQNGTLTSTQDFEIDITDVVPTTPVDSNAAADAVAEGAAIGTAVGVTLFSDEPNGPAVTYELTNTAGGRFAVDPSTGVVTVASGALLDFESSGPAHTFTITGRATIGAVVTATQNFTITVLDAPPSVPVDNNGAGNLVFEGDPNGTLVGITVFSTDPNGPFPTYSLTDSAGGRFQIDSLVGIVTVGPNANLVDFESSGGSYSITAQATVGGLSSSQTFTINIGDVAPTQPTDGNGGTNTVAEGATTGAVVGVTVASTDVNGGTLTYNFAPGGDAGGRFQINTSTGVISVSALGASTIDYETTSPGHSYDVTVVASDGTLTSVTQTFTIAVSNVAPTQPVDNDGGAGGSILEGSATGTVVGVTGFSTDPANTTITYSLTDDAGGRFQINGSSGVVSVGPSGNLIDFETQPAGGYSIAIQASDGQGGTSTQSFLVAAANAAPANFTDTNGGVADSVTEGVASGQATGLTVNATDPAGTTVTYSLTNDAGGRFQINTSTGEVLTGANASLIDFESSLGSYTITVQASDGAGGLGTTDFVIAVADAAPGNWSDLNAAANLVTEGDASNTLASLQANAIDPNGGTVSYSFANLAASAGGRFKIDAATGIISIDNAALVDFESSGGAYAVTVTATTAGGMLISTNGFTIDVADLAPPAPIDINGATNAVTEGEGAGTTVGIEADSLDVNGGNVAYTLTNSAGGLFAIDSVTGVVTVTAAGATGIDFESSGGSYVITVQASDGTLDSTQSFTIAVGNAAPAQPTDANASANVVSVNAIAGATVGVTLSSTDPNGGAVTYVLTDSESGLFAVDLNTGVVTFAGGTLTAGFTYTLAGVAQDPGLATSTAFSFTVFAANNQLNVDLDFDDSNLTTTGNAFSNTFTEQGAAASIGDTDVRITNTGNPGVTDATGATIVLTNAQLNDDVVFTGAAPGGITRTVTTSAGTITVTLTGTASYALYETAIEQIQFFTTGDPGADAPNPTDRTLLVTVTDSTGSSPAALSTIHITRVNDAPALAPSPTVPAVGYAENAAPVALFDTGVVTDPDHVPHFSTGTFTVTITNPAAGNQDHIVLLAGTNFAVSDTALLHNGTAVGSISGLGTAAVSVILITQSATPTVANELARAFGYQNSSDDPTVGARNVTFAFNDGGQVGTGGALPSNIVTQTVNVTAVNDAPTAVDDVAATRAEDTGAPWTITGASLIANDFTGPSGVNEAGQTLTVSLSAANIASAVGGTIALSGQDVVFTPTANFNGTASFDYTIQDNGAGTPSDVGHVTFTVTAVNDAPVLAANASVAPAFTENGAVAQLLSAGTVTDADLPANFAGGGFTIQITAAAQPGDEIVLRSGTGFTLVENGGGTFDLLNAGHLIGLLAYNTLPGGTSVAVDLSSFATPSLVQELIRAFGYRSSADDLDASDRTVQFVFNDGAALSNTVTQLIDLTAVNDAPVNDVPVDTQTVTANGTLTFESLTPHSISVSDVDEPNDLTVTLTATNGTLTLFGGPVFANLTFAVGSDGTDDATMTFTGSQADINAALDGLLYENDGTLGAATITITTEDNDATAPADATDTDVINIDVVAAVVATTPQIDLDFNDSTTALGSTAFVTSYDLAAATPVAVADTDSEITVDVPISATIVLTNAVDADIFQVDNSAAGVLTGTLEFGPVGAERRIDWTITDTNGSGQITVALVNGATTVATPTADDYEDALELITFSTTDPSTVDRTVDVTFSDAGGAGNTATTTIVINDAPTLDLDGSVGGNNFATTYTENGPAAAIADTDVIITDADNTTLFEATITLTNVQTNDLLSINGPLPVGITASAFVAGVLTLTSASGSSLADFQAALQQVVFSNQSENPSTTPRSITVTVNDGTTDSLASTTTVTVTQANDAPALAPATLAAVNEDTANPPGETIANLFSGLFTDNDASAVFAGIAVSANPAAPAQGTWEYSTDVGANWFAVGSVAEATALTLTAASLLRFLPAANFNGTPSALSVYGLDNTFGGAFTAGATRETTDASVNGGTTAISDNATTIGTSITAVNDAPVLDLDLGGAGFDFATTYVISASGRPIADLDVTITDADHTTLVGATVTLTDGLAGDTLAIGGALPAGISGAVSGTAPGAITVTLTGTASLADYQTALRQLVFANGDSASNNATDRHVTVLLDDGLDDSTVRTTTIDVIQDTAPVAVDDVNSGTAGGPPNLTGNAIVPNDSDAENPDSALVITAVRTGAESPVPGNPLAVGNALVGTYGALTLNFDGTYTYQIDNNNAALQALSSIQSVNDVFTYTVRDTAGLTDTAQITITITGANDPPTANPDTPTAVEAGGVNNTALGTDPTGSVTANDTDPDLDTLTVQGVAAGVQAGPLTLNVGSGVSNAANFGTLTIQANGSYTYVVNNLNTTVQGLRTSAQTLQDIFSYTINDGTGGVSTTQVTITIQGQNDNPVAGDDLGISATEAGGTNNGTAGVNPSGNVLTNDTDVDAPNALNPAANGETETVQGVASGDQGSTVISTGVGGAGIAGSFGTLTVNANGSFNYVVNNANATVQGLNVGGTLTDTFTYTMRDTALTTDNALVTFTINGANDAPVAVNDGSAATPAYIAFEGSTLTVTLANGIRNNDTDVDNLTSSLTATKDTNPLHGTVTVNGDGSFTYTPTAGYLGGDSFTYHVNDPDPPGPSVSLASNSATVFIDVQPRVWHIDNAFVGPGTGPLGSATNPFLSIDAFNTANAAAAAADKPDIIYLHDGTGTYTTTDGVNLFNGQTFLGQGVDLTYTTSASAPGGPQLITLANLDNTQIPVIQVTGGAGNAGITLAQNNTLAGFTIETTNADGIGIEDSNAAGVAGAVGTLNVSLVGISGVGKAIDIDQGGTLNVSLSSVASTGSNSEGIQLGGIAGATLGGSFAVTGTTSITNADTTGIQVGTTAANASFSFGTTTVTDNAIGSGHNGNGIDLSPTLGNTNTFSFASLNVTTDAGFGLKAIGAASPNQSTITIGGSGNTINATGGAAVDLTNINLGGGGATFSTVSSANSGTTGIQITGLATGSFTANGGAITDATGTDVSITGGSTNITYNGTITDDVGQLVSVANKTGGTVDFNGAITDGNDGDGSGISLATNTGAFIRFDGGLTLSTGANAAFAATGGGTVNISGTSNHITTTSGTALNVTGTTIGAGLAGQGGLNFQDIAANGAAKGIILNGAGTGGLTVTGSGTTDGSGGTIQNNSTRGVEIINTSNISLKNMNFSNSSTTDAAVATNSNTASLNAGIYLNGASNVTLDNLNISGTNQEGIIAVSVNNLALNNSTIANAGSSGASAEEGAVKARELTGLVTMNNNDFSFSAGQTVEIKNTTGNLILNLDNTTMRDTQSSSSGQGGLQVIATGAGAVHPNVTVNITNSDFLRLRSNGVNVQAVGVSDTDGATADVDISGGTVFDAGAAPGVMIGIDLDADDASTLVFNIIGNTVTARNGPGINIFGDVSASVTGRINSNTVSVAENPGGSQVGTAVRVNLNKNASGVIQIDSNTISSLGDDGGIEVSSIGQTAVNTGQTLQATITNNNITMDASTTYGVFLISASNAGDHNILIGDVANNHVTNAGISAFRARVASVNGQLRLEGFNTDPGVTWDTRGNTPTGNPNFGGGGTFGAGTANPPTNPAVDADPLLAASIGHEIAPLALTDAQLTATLQSAVEHWVAAGLSADQVAALDGVQFFVTDLADAKLAETNPGYILIDSDAAGHGWFVDSTPGDNAEFQQLGSPTEGAATSGEAAGHIDLLTVLMHELGHAIGLAHSDAPGDIMSDTLDAGMRRLPSADDVTQAAAATAAQQQGAAFVPPAEVLRAKEIGPTIANGFDAQYYLAHNPDVAAADVDPLFHFNVVGWQEGRDPNAFFDTEGYLSHYADVAAAGVNPLQHYEEFGWHEGRDPSKAFDTQAYLAANPDVAAAHVNPLDHFLIFGFHEGRAAINDGLWR